MLRSPITGIACCCARAASGHAAAPPRSGLDRQITAFDIANFVQSLGERIGRILCLTRRPGAEITNRRRRWLRPCRDRPRSCRAAKQGNELAPSHEMVSDEVHNLAHHRTTRACVHCTKIRLLMSVQGLVARVSPVQTALRNCTRDEGRSFEVGNQVLISSKSGRCAASAHGFALDSRPSDRTSTWSYSRGARTAQ